MQEIGHVSSFDEREGFGFIRPVKEPNRVVFFHQSDLEEDVEHYVNIGQEVLFERDNDSRHGGWDVVSSVKLRHASEEEAGDIAFESDAL